MINKCNIILGYYTYKYFVFKSSHGLFFFYSIRKSKDEGESSENFLFGWYGMLSRLDRCLKLTLYLIETFANSLETPLLDPSNYNFSGTSWADGISALV